MTRKGFVERRKHERFEVRDDTPVILRSNNSRVGSAVDVSMGGLGFRYVGRMKPVNESARLSILPLEDAPCLYRIPCRLVWDCKVGKDPYSTIGPRQCGVQFAGLRPEEEAQLRYYIKKHSTAVNK